jgi:protein-disulfide isomerase
VDLRIFVLVPLAAAAAGADTLNGPAALVAIIQASPNLEKAPEVRANPFTTLPGTPAKAPAVKPQPFVAEGNPASQVRVVVYEDLQCPDSAAYRRMLDEKLLPAYQDRVAFEHRDFPLPRHAWARKAAIAARFFEETRPELAVEFRRQMLANLRQITADNFNDRLAEFARRNGADPAQAIAALAEPRYNDLVEKDYQDGIARDVSKTPTVFVNGRAFVETFTVEEISKAIEEELKR